MRTIWSVLITLLLATPVLSQTNGPLHACSPSSGYFCDASGQALLLTGSHVWQSMYDRTVPYDYAGYLAFLQARGHNFIRLWAWEETIDPDNRIVGPEYPWLRTGPGVATDGLPKFDLMQPNPNFYTRLQARVQAARDAGIYVSLMLFEGWELQFDTAHWAQHPFNPANNINGIDGGGANYHSLSNATITNIQQLYVRQAIDTLNSLNNVLYEIANESLPTSADAQWQYTMINFIHGYEAGLPQQHPVGMTWEGGAEKSVRNNPLWASPADWISPGCVKCFGGGSFDDYAGNPPASSGPKVVLSDTDHIYGEGGDGVWVWKTALRGLNPLFMDGGIQTFPATNDWRNSARNAMGKVRSYTQRAGLNTLSPQNSLASSGYCLCSTTDYLSLAFPPNGNKAASVTVSLSTGTFSVEWVNANTGQVVVAPTVSGGGNRTFVAPSSRTTYAIYLHRQ